MMRVGRWLWSWRDPLFFALLAVAYVLFWLGSYWGWF